MKQYCETSNIVLAATLKLRGYELDRIEKEAASVLFCFADVEQSELRKFEHGKQLVEPTALCSAVEVLTSVLKKIV